MTNDRPPVPQPADLPLGIQRPLLPSVPLGQSLLQPKFLTPLGARSLSVLDPTIFLSGQDADLSDWESPFQDSPFFDPAPARSPEALTPAVQTKPQSQPAAPNPTTIDSPLNPSIEAATPFESVADFSPVDFSSVDPVAAPDFSKPTLAPSDSISEPEATPPPAIAPESTVQRSSENSPGSDFPEAPARRSPENLPDLDFAEATVQRSPENLPDLDFAEATVQRSPENLLGSEAIVLPANPQLDPPDLAPEASQPTLTESAAIDRPATVQRSPENPSPENSPVPLSEATAIAPTLTAETPVSQAALAETITSPSPVEPERSTAPESVAPPVLPPPPATIQRVETPEAAAEIEPILAEESIDPEPVTDADVAPAIQAKLEPTVSPSDLPIAQPVSNSPEPTIARLAEEPTPPAPLPQERGAGEEAVTSELEQSSGEEILPDSATSEAVEPPRLAIEPALIEPSPSSSPSDKSESNLSTNSETEPTPSETVQRSVSAPETLGFEPERSVEAIVPSVIDERPDFPETVQRRVEQPENSVAAIAPSVSDDRTDAPETVQRKIEVPIPTETRAEEFNQPPVEPNRAIDAPESSTETVAQASSLPGQNAGLTSDEPPKAQESRSPESIPAQDQPIDTRVDSLETPAESLPQVASIEPIQNPAIVPPQIQTLAEIAPSSPQPIQPESQSNFSPPAPSEISGEAPVTLGVETENIPLQLIQLEAQDQQDQSVPSVELNRAEGISQAASSADSAVQLKVQEQPIAPNATTPIEQPEAISQPSIQMETEEFPSEQIVSPAELETPPDYSQERDRAEEASSPPPQPIAENLSSPIQRKAIEANSLETASIALPEAEPETAIAQNLSEASIAPEAEPETAIVQNPAPSIDRSESESQPSPIDEIVPSSTATIEPQLQRSTSETERLTERSTSEIEPPQGSTSEVQPRATTIEPPLQRSTSETEPSTSEIGLPLQQSTGEVQLTEEISSPSALRRKRETFPEAEPATSLPELPTVIQKLSVLEPIAQMKLLYSSTDSATVQPSQAARSLSIPELQTQQFDRLFDLPSEPPSVMRKSDGAAPDSAPASSPVTAEWANIAELFQASEESSASPQLSSNGSSELEGELELNRELNGYSDLNLSSTNATPSDVIQAKPERVGDLPNSEALIAHSESHDSSQAQASPEQLERLAQEIYQLVRQRLALERERFGNAGSGRLF